MITENVLQTLKKDGWYDPLKPVLVGVSGGPDSLALMHIFHQAGVKMVVAHLDHCLRAISHSDAEAVKNICSGLGIECIIKSVDVKAYSIKHKMSIEEAARSCRYQFIFHQAKVHHALAVVVAHTADDQVETILMHLLRGAGMSGLSGMQTFEHEPHWNPKIPLVRPMLGIWRNEVMIYCEKNGLEPIIDESNNEQIYLRNRIRHSLIPNLEKYNCQVKKELFKMADVVREDNQLLNEISEEILKICLEQQAIDFISIKRDHFQAQPLSLQRRMLRLGIKKLRPDLRDIGFDSIVRALNAITNKHSGGYRLNLGSGLDLVVEDDVFHILEEGQEAPLGDLPQLCSISPQLLNPGESVELENGWVLSARMLKAEDTRCLSGRLLEDPLQAWISPSTLKESLFIRGKQEGDRWRPMGLGGHSQKLSDFFINEKIPPGARLKWPLVVSGEEIIWVAGFRPADKTALSGEESIILNLSLEKLS